MYFNDFVDTFDLESTENKYGDKVSIKTFRSRVKCTILEASFEDMPSDSKRQVKLISSEKIPRDVLFSYDNDLFVIKRFRRTKGYFVAFGELIADVF